MKAIFTGVLSVWIMAGNIALAGELDSDFVWTHRQLYPATRRVPDVKNYGSKIERARAIAVQILEKAADQLPPADNSRRIFEVASSRLQLASIEAGSGHIDPPREGLPLSVYEIETDTCTQDEIVAFVRFENSKKITVCYRSLIYSPDHLGQQLVHEAIHLAQIKDEVETSRLQFKAVLLNKLKAYRNGYLEKHKESFADFDLNKFHDAPSFDLLKENDRAYFSPVGWSLHKLRACRLFAESEDGWHKAIAGTLLLGSPAVYPGSIKKISLISAGTIGREEAERSTSKWNNALILGFRGETTFQEKSCVIRQAGGIGGILFDQNESNSDLFRMPPDLHAPCIVPMVRISKSEALALQNRLLKSELSLTVDCEY